MTHSNFRTKKFLLPVAIAITALTFLSFKFSGTRHEKKTPEKQTFYGPAVKTRGYHNSTCDLCNGDPYPHECYDKWCFGKYNMSVSAPKGWTLTGKPFLHCVENNQGSCEWNGNYGQSTIRVTESNARYVEAIVLVGSREITVNLGCEATRDE